MQNDNIFYVYLYVFVLTLLALYLNSLVSNSSEFTLFAPKFCIYSFREMLYADLPRAFKNNSLFGGGGGVGGGTESITGI